MLRVPLVATLYVVACVAREPSLDGACTASTCAHDLKDAVKGSTLLQLRQTSSVSACDTDQAKEQPLTEAGFQEISKSCCYEDLKAFTRRLVDEMGLKVCDEGGLSGIAPFYSCPLSPVTLAELKKDLSKAMPAGASKCHWLQDRYVECTEPALECGVSVQKPPPAPKPVASGFIAFRVGNPSEMLRSSRAIDVMKNELSLALGVATTYVNVVIGSGPLDGEEVASSLFLVPKSQAFYTLEGSAVCKVFVAYSIQESAPNTRSITTPAPTLNEQDIVDKLKRLDTAGLGKRVTQDLVDVDRVVGTVEVIENTICEKTSLKCTHEVIKEVS